MPHLKLSKSQYAELIRDIEDTLESTVATNRHCHCNTYATRNYTMEGSAVAHFIVNMGAGNGLFIVGM